MEELDGDYVVVDQNTYHAGRYDIRVVGGKIRSLAEDSIRRHRRVTEPTPTTVCVDPTDISIIVDPSQPHILLDYTTAN